MKPEAISLRFRRIIALAALTALALLIHGYHPYAEDAEIYLPGVLKILNPSLFPANAAVWWKYVSVPGCGTLTSARATTFTVPNPRKARSAGS